MIFYTYIVLKFKDRVKFNLYGLLYYIKKSIIKYHDILYILGYLENEKLVF